MYTKTGANRVCSDSNLFPFDYFKNIYIVSQYVRIGSKQFISLKYTQNLFCFLKAFIVTGLSLKSNLIHIQSTRITY